MSHIPCSAYRLARDRGFFFDANENYTWVKKKWTVNICVHVKGLELELHQHNPSESNTIKSIIYSRGKQTEPSLS